MLAHATSLQAPKGIDLNFFKPKNKAMRKCTDKAWEEYISQYPTYDRKSAPIAYDLSSQTVAGISYSTPFDLRETTGVVMLDNTTLLDGHVVLGVSDGVLSISEDTAIRPSVNSGRETLLSLANSVILHEGLAIDGFVFSNSPRARAVAKLFNGVIKPVYFSTKDRVKLHEIIYPHYKKNASEFDKISQNNASFNNGAMIDRHHFADWWDQYAECNTINLTSPDEEDLEVDIAIPVYLRNSTFHAYRTMYYLALSEFCQAPYKPHSSREAVSANRVGARA